MRSSLTLTLLLVATCPFAQSQVAPAASSGTSELRYAFRYAETAEHGTTFGTWNTIDTSGSLDYMNGRTRRPFSLEYTGGYTSTVSGPSWATGVFQRMSIYQGFNWHTWLVDFRDDVGYRPQAPTTGYSGIPGTGEPIGGNGAQPPSSQLILTVNTHSLSNDASAGLTHFLSYGSQVRVEAHQSLLRYPDGNGLDTDQLMVGAAPTFRINARNSFVAHYAYSRFTYPDYDTLLETHSVTFGYDRQWNRSLHTSASAGPEWVQPSPLTPRSTGVAAHTTLTYQVRRFSTDLSYYRATSGGSGYFMGAQYDFVTADLSRSFAHTFLFEVSGGYQRNADLATKNLVTGGFASIQGSWQIGRYLNAFANYTAMSQTSAAPVSANVLNELLQVVSFGIGLSKNMKGTR